MILLIISLITVSTILLSTIFILEWATRPIENKTNDKDFDKQERSYGKFRLKWHVVAQSISPFLSKVHPTFSFMKKNWHIIPAIILVILVYATFKYKNLSLNDAQITNLGNQTIRLSGIVAAIIIGFISSYVIQIRREKRERLKEIRELTQKVHYFRSIVNHIMHNHGFWLDNSPGHLLSRTSKYSKLIYSDIRPTVVESLSPEISSLKKEFDNDTRLGPMKDLFLELKTLVGDTLLDPTIYSEFETPIRYNLEALLYYVNYNMGNGLYYYFDHKYAIYSQYFDFHKFISRDKDSILRLCSKIDKERYRDVDFGAKLFSMLGTQFEADVFPKLYELESINDKGLPNILIYLYVILSILLLGGVILPIIVILLDMNPEILLFSIILILATTTYFIISYFGKLNQEIKV